MEQFWREGYSATSLADLEAHHVAGRLRRRPTDATSLSECPGFDHSQVVEVVNDRLDVLTPDDSDTTALTEVISIPLEVLRR